MAAVSVVSSGECSMCGSCEFGCSAELFSG